MFSYYSSYLLAKFTIFVLICPKNKTSNFRFGGFNWKTRFSIFIKCPYYFYTLLVAVFCISFSELKSVCVSIFFYFNFSRVWFLIPFIESDFLAFNFSFLFVRTGFSGSILNSFLSDQNFPAFNFSFLFYSIRFFPLSILKSFFIQLCFCSAFSF